MTGLVQLWRQRPGGPVRAIEAVTRAIHEAEQKGLTRFEISIESHRDLHQVQSMFDVQRRLVPGVWSGTIRVDAR